MSKSAGLGSLKEQVREISRIASTVPEEFRQKCFELLMTHLLSGGSTQAPSAVAPQVVPNMPSLVPPVAPSPAPVAAPVQVSMAYASAPPMTALLSAFVRKIGLTTEQFASVVGVLHGNVVFFREPASSKGAQAQIEWSLLLALKNAILRGAFLVDAEEVRLTCQEKGVFDRRSFFTNFRRAAEYFRSPPEPGGRPQPLSNKGISALGELVKALADGG